MKAKKCFGKFGDNIHTLKCLDCLDYEKCMAKWNKDKEIKNSLKGLK
jgi:hypothetical protein